MGGGKKPVVAADDEAVLEQLGYKQVLYRSWGFFTTATIGISAMSVLTSISGARCGAGAVAELRSSSEHHQAHTPLLFCAQPRSAQA